MATKRANTRISAGQNVRLRQTPFGPVIGFTGSRASFIHPFKVALTGKAATIRPGRVNGVATKIKDVPLEGDDEHAPPRLDLRQLKLDREGRGYIALEVTCAKKDWSVEKVAAVQVAWIDRDQEREPGEEQGGPGILGGTPILPGRRCRHPLAMLRQRKSGRLDLFQVCYFNLQLRVAVRELSGGKSSELGRAFFWPA